MARCKDFDWNLSDTPSWDRTHAAILMDIRDELKSLNALLHCHNFVAIPHTLKRISQNTTKRKRKPK
jgi:hypothetical protein